jgi:hypothetical protein
MVAEVHPPDLANHVHGDHLFALLKRSAAQLSTLVNFESADPRSDGQFPAGVNTSKNRWGFTRGIDAPCTKPDLPVHWQPGELRSMRTQASRPASSEVPAATRKNQCPVSGAESVNLNFWIGSSTTGEKTAPAGSFAADSRHCRPSGWLVALT